MHNIQKLFQKIFRQWDTAMQSDAALLHWRFVVVISAISSVLVMTTLPTTSHAAKPALDLRGFVQTANGSALHGATIQLVSQKLSATSDSLGRFHLESQSITSIHGTQSPAKISWHNQTLFFYTAHATPIQIKVFNSLGGALFSASKTYLAGNHSFTVQNHLPSLPHGIYYLQFTDDSGTVTLPLRILGTEHSDATVLTYTHSTNHSTFYSPLVGSKKPLTPVDSITISKKSFHAATVPIYAYIENIPPITLFSKTAKPVIDSIVYQPPTPKPGDTITLTIFAWDNMGVTAFHWDTNGTVHSITDSVFQLVLPEFQTYSIAFTAIDADSNSSDTLTVPIEVIAFAPTAVISLASQESFFNSFESNTWYNAQSWSQADAPWIVDTNIYYHGNSSLRSPPIANEKNTTVTLHHNTTVPSEVSFYYRTSTEREYDWFSFTIDDGYSPLLQAHGETGWTYFKTALQPGTHTLTWKYQKDYIGSEGLDAVWIDSLAIQPQNAGEFVSSSVNDTLVFHAQVKDDGTVDKYSWFAHNTWHHSDLATFTYIAGSQEYKDTVILRVQDNHKLYAYDTLFLQIDANPPTAVATSHKSSYLYLDTVQLISQNSSDNKGIIEYTWFTNCSNFTCTDSITLLEPSRATYITGTQNTLDTLLLRVTDADKQSAWDTLVFTVYEAPPSLHINHPNYSIYNFATGEFSSAFTADTNWKVLVDPLTNEYAAFCPEPTYPDTFSLVLNMPMIAAENIALRYRFASASPINIIMRGNSPLPDEPNYSYFWNNTYRPQYINWSSGVAPYNQTLQFMCFSAVAYPPDHSLFKDYDSLHGAWLEQISIYTDDSSNTITKGINDTLPLFISNLSRHKLTQTQWFMEDNWIDAGSLDTTLILSSYGTDTIIARGYAYQWGYDTLIIHVRPFPPTARIYNDSHTVSVNATINLDARFSTDSLGISEYAWFLECDTIQCKDSIKTTSVDTFYTAGMQEATYFNVLRVQNIKGEYGYDTMQVAVTIPKPIVGLTSRFISSIENFENFTVTTASNFETGGNWDFSLTNPWVVDETGGYNSAKSLRSAPIGNNQSSAIDLNYAFLYPGNLHFYVKTSTERNYDIAYLYVNEVRTKSWHGTNNWQPVSIPVTAGSYTFAWRYNKDGSYSAGNDAVWIDSIYFSRDNPSTLPIQDSLTLQATVTGDFVEDSLEWFIEGAWVPTSSTDTTIGFNNPGPKTIKFRAHNQFGASATDSIQVDVVVNIVD